VVEYALQCLRFWVDECHVDGFRFDLASVMGVPDPIIAAVIDTAQGDCRPFKIDFRAMVQHDIEDHLVAQFASEPRLQRMGLSNYWGYNPLALFALEPRYASQPQRALDEFRDAVRRRK
jgi:pullulanase/glycogen debranching enzyme